MTPDLVFLVLTSAIVLATAAVAVTLHGFFTIVSPSNPPEIPYLAYFSIEI